MPVINTNMLSLMSQSQLARTQNGLSLAIQRLSTGLRINSASDDAAGQSIANRMTSQAKGFSQAKKNTSDGISLLQTTEGALNAINGNLQRIRELSVQAANDTNSPADLNAIQAEIHQRLDEIDRISSQSHFNGKSVLNREGTIKLQTGVFDEDTTSVQTKIINTESLGINFFNVNGLNAVSPINQSDADKLTNNAAIPLESLKIDESLANNEIIRFSKEHGLHPETLTSNHSVYKDDAGVFYMRLQVTQPNSDESTLKSLRMPTKTSPETFFFVAINAAAFNPDTQTLRPNRITQNALIPGHINPTDTIKVIEPSSQEGKVEIYEENRLLNSLKGVLDNTLNAKTMKPLTKLDEALDNINTHRGNLGAVINRIESTLNNLSTSFLNISASRSKIEDTEYAIEVSNMSLNQLLQQSGMAVLIQANQTPDLVLQLLK